MQYQGYLLTLFFSIALHGCDAQQATPVNTFYNVVAQSGADPWVYKHTDGWYYSTRTTGGDVRIWRSRSLTSLGAGYSKSIWGVISNSSACRDIWAPEIHYIQSKWYVYFAATTCNATQDADRRMFVLENINADPFVGSFGWKGKITDVTDRWAIDGTVLQHPTGQLYFIWSGWEGSVNVRQLLYIARMSNPWTITGPRVEISRPTYTWETNHAPYINEGPEVSVRNGTISLVYSASGSWTDDYCLGLITALVSSNLTDPASWQKRSSPIFQSSGLIYGPGHHSFTKSRDDQEDWIVYHSARFKGAGWTRQIRAQRFTWNADSTPNLGFPVAPNTPIALPSGDLSRTRYEAEDALLVNGSRVMWHSSASNGSKVGGIDAVDSMVVFTVQCSRAGRYVIAARTGNGSPSNATATHLLKINSGSEFSLPTVYSGWNMWGTTMVVTNLTQGANTLSFRKGSDYVEIDAVDIFLDE